jgi:hypothetical protein
MSHCCYYPLFIEQYNVAVIAVLLADLLALLRWNAICCVRRLHEVLDSRDIEQAEDK